MGNKMQIRGMQKVLKNFERFGRDIKQEVDDELLASCKVNIETKAKEKLTRDGHVDTGALRSSIQTKKIKDMSYKIGTNLPYAWKIERLDSYMLYSYMQGKSEIVKDLNKILDRVCSQYG